MCQNTYFSFINTEDFMMRFVYQYIIVLAFLQVTIYIIKLLQSTSFFIFFPFLRTSLFRCAVIVPAMSLGYPAFDLSTHTCYIQADADLLACTGMLEDGSLRRVCPCVEMSQTQSSLCRTCV